MAQERQDTLPKNIETTVKHGHGLMKLWGCFSASSAGKLVKIERIFKSNNDITIWDENLKI